MSQEGQSTERVWEKSRGHLAYPYGRSYFTCKLKNVLIPQVSKLIPTIFASTHQKLYPDLGSNAPSMLNLCARFSVVIIFARTPLVASRNVGCFLRQTCTWNIALSRFFSPRISYLVTCLSWRPPTGQMPWTQPSADPGDWTERLRLASLMLLIVRIFWERFWGLWHIASRRRNLPGNK